MIREASASWLVPLTDLSLILFIVTGGALSADPAPLQDAAPAEGVAAALYVDGSGAPPLLDMLAAHEASLGEQLTVQGYYAPGERARVARRAEALAAQAINAGVEPRVIVQPARQSLVIARFAHDADPGLARGLQTHGE